MVEHLLRNLPLLGRYSVILLLVVVVALLGPAAAAQTFCPPDCDMHKPAPAPPSCCESSAMDHQAMGTSGHGPLSSPSPEPCCEGNSCIDPSAVVPEFTLALSSIESDINASANRRDQMSYIQFAASVKVSFEPNLKGPPIPVYIRTGGVLI